jgi:hypothetical protein
MMAIWSRVILVSIIGNKFLNWFKILHLMANTAVSHILVSEVVMGATNEKRGNRTRGIPVDGAIFDTVDAGTAEGIAGANSKVVYRDALGVQVPIFVTETTADLVAKANGNVAASSV